jgi:NADH-quinone oxidoreductase subunit J
MVKDIIFIGISIVIVASAVMAVGFKSTLHNAFSLMLCLAGVAGIFILLSGEFVAVMEIVVYVGAVAIAIIFAIMFSPPLFMTQPKRSLLKVMRSAAIAVFLFLAI